MNQAIRRRGRTAFLALAMAAVGCGYTGPEPTCPDGGTSLDWEGFAQPFYETYCNRCHSTELEGHQRQGAPDWWNFDTYAAATARATAEGDLGPVWEQVAVLGYMPPNMWVRPSSAEIRDLGEWLACGQPE